MLQIVHDVAPGATLVFHTGAGGPPRLAAAILALANAGADIIVDDLYGSSGEPMFQDGIAAQAVDQVVRGGVAYFTFAGNERRDSYQSPFRPSGIPITINGQPAGEAHDFDPGPGVDIFQRITIPEGDNFAIVLQWDAPFFSVSGPPGAPNDLEVYLLNDPPTTELDRSDGPNIGGDALEILIVDNPVGSGVTTFNILITRFAGLNPGLLKYVLIPSFLGTIDEFHTRSGTVYGHRNAAGAATIGAAPFHATPAFGVDPARLWRFSSAGPTPILYNTAGQRFLRPKIRQKPELVAPTGGNNTFWGEDAKSDLDTDPNFFGTSASAPHAAAVAALMLQLNPTLSPRSIYTILESTAADMRTPGFDFASGFGLIQADQALQAVPVTPVMCQGLLATIVGTPGQDIITGTPGQDIIHGRGGDDIINGLGGDDVICGGRGSDVLYGGAGHDGLDGGDQTDFCDGGNPFDGDTAGSCEIAVNTP
jgi:subtilisin family serine protease